MVIAGALGSAAYFAYLIWIVRDPVDWVTRQTMQWHHRTTWPGETLAVSFGKFVSEQGITINKFDLVVTLLFTGLMLAAFRLRLSYGLYMAIILAPIWFHTNDTFPLMSATRYVLVAFPGFLVLARWAAARPRWVHLAIITLWISLMLVWVMVYIHGHWVA
jgi:hypothetical protein